MIFDTTRDDIILISYPSGGFGNFIFHMVSNHSADTVKFHNKLFTFSDTGDSHNTTHYCNIYYKDPTEYQPTILTKNPGKLVVLCDNGVNNDSYDKVRAVFPNSTIVRAVIDAAMRPVVYNTMIVKAMKSDTGSSREHVAANWIDAQTDYAIRENFTLMYRSWQFKWDAMTSVVNVSILQLVVDPITCITKLITELNSVVVDMDTLVATCETWKNANSKYFAVYYAWLDLEQALDDNTYYEFDISDLHTQGYLNYCIETKYNVIIPVYDYKDWFTNSYEIQEMIKCYRGKTI